MQRKNPELAYPHGCPAPVLPVTPPDFIGLRKGLRRLGLHVGHAIGGVTVGKVGAGRMMGYTVIRKADPKA